MKQDSFIGKGGIIFFSVLAFAALVLSLVYFFLFAAPDRSAEIQIFVVARNADLSKIPQELETRGFIKNANGFNFARILNRAGQMQFGGYRISKAMNAFEIAGVLDNEPSLKWISVPEGMRKEEIAEVLASVLKWNEAEKENFANAYKSMQPDYIEGVYFPSTYLIPINNTGADVAKRMTTEFETRFAPLKAEAAGKNIKWTTVLKLASLIQREAAGHDDMGIISGVLWNRLDINMKLDIDATLQYILGKPGAWWPPVQNENRKISSPFNTYIHKGLPPHPIANPGLDAIRAALNPAKTDCFYYLHDKQRDIHCAETFAEHRANIQKYLRPL